MNDSDYNALVGRLHANERAMLAEAQRLGRASVAELRPVTKGPKTGKPMAYGLTRELQALQESGLLRRVGRNPAVYEPVKAADVENAVLVYNARKRRSRKRRSTRSRIVELRTYEHGEYSEWYRVHHRLIESTEYIGRQLSRMAFWEAAPKEDLARSVDDLADLVDAIDQAIVCLKERAEDDAILAKIEKLEKTKGRSAAESESARALARKLRTQYEDRLRS